MLLFVLACLALTSHTAIAAPPERVPDEVLVRFKPTATASEIRDFMDQLGATRLRRFQTIRTEQHHITRASVEDAVSLFRNHPAVEQIEPNYIVHADDVPNDAQFHLLWGLQNTGQTGGTPGADIGAVAAWDIQTGSASVVVAVIDTGVDIHHPDLASNIWINPGEIAGNQIDDDGNGLVDDVNGYDFYNLDPDPMDDVGHGTHVAGTIAAAGNNALGVTGVAWNARIMPLKFLGSDGSGPVSAAVDCIDYAVRMGAQIMNNSWGGAGFSSTLLLAIQSANAVGIPFVAAAGNAGVSLDTFRHYPASYDVPNVIAVASTTHQDALSSFSNYGATSVHLAAPGSSIWSTRPGAEYGYESGTSMAAPHVSGALALLRSEFPDMPGAQLKNILLSSVTPVPSLEGFVLTGGRLDVARMLVGPDSIPPASIGSLAVERVDSDQMVLRWTATGDDGETGRASRYDLRFDTGPIDESSFAFAHPAGEVPAPSPAGSPEVATVEGLQFGTTYYFAVKAIDEYGNASPISNLASAHTTGPPRIAVTPLSLEQSLQTGQRAEEQVTITNLAAEGTLEFAAASARPGPEATVQPYLVLEKGAPDPRVGDAVLDGRGGPDGFGYEWIDNDEPGSPAFQWTDISSVGTRVALEGDDGISGFVPIGFLFPFYDNLYAYVRVTTNGYLSFSASTSDYTNQTLPNASAPENMVAPFWDDLAFSGNSAAYAWTDGQRFIVQWTNVFHFTGGGPYTFQAILHADGTIVYQYLTVGFPTSSATVGIQNASRNDGLTIVFNNSYVHGGLAVRLHAAPSWVSVVPATGRIGPGESLPITVRFDASRLPGDTYDAILRLTSNDPQAPVTDLPARLVVGGATDIAFAAPSLAFLQIFVGATETQSIAVTNEGVLPLNVTSVRADPPVFEVDDAAFTLQPGESRDLEVRFRPTAAGNVQGTLTVTSNDPDEGTATVSLFGSSFLPPDVTVTPGALSASLFTGESTTREVTIGNTGVSNLTWSIVPHNGMTRTASAVTLEPPHALGIAPDGAVPDPSIARTGAITADLVALDGVRILFDGAHESAGTTGWSRLIEDLTLRGAAITRNTSPISRELLDAFDILWITDSQKAWTVEEVIATRDWVLTGGALLLEGDNPASIPIFNTLLRATASRFRYQEVRGASGVTERVYPHPVTRSVTRVNLDANLATLTGIVAPAVLLLEDLAGQPSGAAISVGGGRILAFTDEVFSDFHSSFADNQLLANQAFDWLSGMTWLRASPASGTTPSGGTSPVAVTIDATGLAGGDYLASLVVASDDPDETEISVPVSLHVTGAPDLMASPTTLAFDTLFTGQADTLELRIVNRGSDVLDVSAASIPLPEFTVEPATLRLVPLQRATMRIRFAPAEPGAWSTTLTIESNDPDSPTLVPVTAVALPPPRMTVEPRAITAAVLPGRKAVKTVRIRNSGGSDLRWAATAPGAPGIPDGIDAWLTPVPSGGVVPPGSAANVELRIDASALEVGDHGAAVTFSGNDPATPTLSVAVLAHVGSVDAVASTVEPNTLNLSSRGRWAVARIELPPDYDVTQVDPSTVTWNGAVPLAKDTELRIGDYNSNGVPDLELRFDRDAIDASLPEGTSVPITIVGEIRDITWFVARDEVRVLRPRVTVPNGGEVLPAGSELEVRWEEPAGLHVDHADLTVSLDGGESWEIVAAGIHGTSYTWTLPHTPTTRARIRVHLYDELGVLGYDASDAAFTIQPALTSVESETAPPLQYALHPNAPNPFNPETWIRFDLPRAGRVSLRIYGVDGRLVREWRKSLPPGRHRIRWDGTTASGTSVAAGIYFATLRVEGLAGFEASRRMMVVK